MAAFVPTPRVTDPRLSASDPLAQHRPAGPLADTPDWHEVVVAALRVYLPGLIAVYAFGSRLHGTQNADSDLDLAVLVAGYAAPDLLWHLSGELADKLACPVDLLDLRAASTVMQYQVLTQGAALWAAQPQAALFECYVMSEKLSLDEARAGLLADIARDGRIYV